MNTGPKKPKRPCSDCNGYKKHPKDRVVREFCPDKYNVIKVNVDKLVPTKEQKRILT